MEFELAYYDSAVQRFNHNTNMNNIIYAGAILVDDKLGISTKNPPKNKEINLNGKWNRWVEQIKKLRDNAKLLRKTKLTMERNNQ